MFFLVLVMTRQFMSAAYYSQLLHSNYKWLQTQLKHRHGHLKWKNSFTLCLGGTRKNSRGSRLARWSIPSGLSFTSTLLTPNLIFTVHMYCLRAMPMPHFLTAFVWSRVRTSGEILRWLWAPPLPLQSDRVLAERQQHARQPVGHAEETHGEAQEDVLVGECDTTDMAAMGRVWPWTCLPTLSSFSTFMTLFASTWQIFHYGIPLWLVHSGTKLNTMNSD